MASAAKLEQEHTSVLNIFFQHENVCGEGTYQHEVPGFEVVVGQLHNS